MRRRVLHALAAALILAAAGCDWPTFHQGPDRSGATPDTAISAEAVSGSMVFNWAATTGGAVSSSPAVVAGVVHVGSGDGKLYAFDATGSTGCGGVPRSCSPLWTATTGGAVSSSPAVVGGVVYVGSGDGKLYAFDAAGSTNCSGGPKSCSPLWTATTGGVVSSSPAVVGGVLYVGSGDGKLYAFDAAGSTNCSGGPKSCSPLWTATTGGVVSSSPAVVGGVLYVGSGDGKLYAFDAAGSTNCSGGPKSCSPLWTATTGGVVSSSPAVVGGVVYVGSDDHKLYAFDATGSTGCGGVPRSCSPLWTGATGGVVHSSPAVDSGSVYVGSDDHKLYAFDAAGSTNCSGGPKTCAPLWTATTGGVVSSSPAVANHLVYVGSGDGTLSAYDGAGTNACSGAPKSCSALWAVSTGGAVASSPAVADGVVYAGSNDTKVYAFGLERIPPTTSVTMPSNGATLSGTVVLAATASDDVKVSRVEFHLTGGNFNDVLVGVGAKLQNSWVFNWDTVPVPNGAYTLTSVAFDPAGNIGRSPGVAVTVQYQGCGNTHSGLAPCDLRNAYRLPSSTAGAGHTVAIVDAFDDPNAEADLGVYRSTYGLPACTTANGCFLKVNQNGQTSNPPVADTHWAEEISLDIEMVSAVCPNCRILLAEANTNSIMDLVAAENTAFSLGATEISNSWSSNEFSAETALDPYFNHPGIPITASSGDGGYAAGTQWPASSAYVTAVGGTNLAADASPRGWSESAWSGAGSGCSAFVPKPSWQTDSGCSKRTVADVAAIAGSPGVAVYDTYNNSGWIRLGGTSVGAPILAGVYALGAPAAGLPSTYAHPNLLFDVVSGANGNCSGSYLCTAVPGYDGPTGLGTPCGTAAFGTGNVFPGGCGGAGASPSLRSAPVQPLRFENRCAVPAPGSVGCHHGLVTP